jgi:hypothetical protein
MRDTMIALIKNDNHGLDILCPIPEWVNAIAFSVFDCYGYALCADYTAPEDDIVPQFEFSTKEIENPWRQGEDDPATVTQRIATQVVA